MALLDSALAVDTTRRAAYAFVRKVATDRICLRTPYVSGQVTFLAPALNADEAVIGTITGVGTLGAFIAVLSPPTKRSLARRTPIIVSTAAIG